MSRPKRARALKKNGGGVNPAYTHIQYPVTWSRVLAWTTQLTNTTNTTITTSHPDVK
jgi:hypothetical protein